MNELIDAPTFFRLAKNISKYSLHPKYRLGAVLVSNGHPVGIGCNKYKTHPEALYSGLHAEIEAIRGTGKDRIKGSSIFVYREKKCGIIGMARPCENCMEALKDFGVRWIYYSTEEYPFWNVERITG